MRRRAGFTLVELMVVVAIIGLMLGLGAPALLGSLPGMRVSGASRQVLSDLRLARTRAVEKGANAYVVFDGSGAYTVFIDQDGDGALSAGELVKTVDIDGTGYGYSGVVYGSAHSAGDDLGPGAATTQLFFRPNGSASAGRSVYLNSGADDDRHRRVLILAATGNARIQTWDGSTWN